MVKQHLLTSLRPLRKRVATFLKMLWMHQTLLSLLVMLTLIQRCSPSPLSNKRFTFANSLSLTLSTRTRVQRLMIEYEQKVFGDEKFENTLQSLETLPEVSIDYKTWLRMQDAERLRLASQSLHTFWTHLDSEQKLLEHGTEERGETPVQRRDKRGRPRRTLRQSFRSLQMDLWDLMKQVESQLNLLVITSSTQSPLSPTTPSHSTSNPVPGTRRSAASTSGLGSRNLQSSSRTEAPHSSTTEWTHSSKSSMKRPYTTTSVSTTKPALTSALSESTKAERRSYWDQQVRAYVILRRLEHYLSRLARDYTALQAKYNS